MADVIVVSSDDSDVEVIDSYSYATTKDDPLPLADVRVDIDVVNANVPPRYIDLTDPKWILPELKIRKRLHSTGLAVVDLTESDLTKRTEKKTENFLPNEYQFKKESSNYTNQTPSNGDFTSSSSVDKVVFAPQQDCDDQKPKLRRFNSPTQNQTQHDDAHASNQRPAVKLKRLPLLETHFKDLETSKCSVYLTKDSAQMSLCFRESNNENEQPQCIDNVCMTTMGGSDLGHSLNESPTKVVDSPHQVQRKSSNTFTTTHLSDKNSQRLQSPPDSPYCVTQPSSCKENTSKGGLFSAVFTPSPSSPSSHHKAEGEFNGSNMEECDLEKADTRKALSDSSPNSPITQPTSCQAFDMKPLSLVSPISPNHKSEVDSIATSEHLQGKNTSNCQLEETDGPSNSPEFLYCTTPSEPALSVSKTGDLDEGCGTETYSGGLVIDSPVSFPWQEGSDGEDLNEDSQFEMHFRAASTEDRNFVCPVILRKMMSGPAQALIDMEDEGFGAPEVLCRQSLSLVYSTIDENYTEGTLQLLSDLLQPGYYPPRDITMHLLHGILLDPQCPYHLCEQAFNLLMRTQRHHMADRTTIPWDWELLTTLMVNQDNARKCRNEVVRMLLEYVVQTLWDDFQAKRSLNALHQSIAKETLSCDQKFHQVRDIMKWLFAAIMKATENGGNKAHRDEQIRIVSILQRMLSLSLEVDRSPTLSSGKVSQELFHMLITKMPLRAHRMLLLESLQSKLLRCKLLEHLLDYACPLKIPLPMSLGLLLHFLKNCTLAPDPMDGTDRWQRWEELVHLLWMLLLSYNKAMKGYLCSSASEQSGRVGMLVYRSEDKVSRSAIREAVEAFLSRSQADLGQALPLHVEESLTYLQDHLLDVCQC